MSQSLASKILGFLPDKWNLALRYFKNTRHILHFKNPKRFTEKLQLYKLEKNFPLMAKCHDKYTVHEYVKEKGLGDILVPIYQVAKKSSELDFDSLPDKFVMKTTNWGGTNIFCEDKATFDWQAACKQLDAWLSADVEKLTLEKSLLSEPKIIVEKMLDKDSRGDVPDYKFSCFNGIVKDVFIVTDRYNSEQSKKIYFTDRDYNVLPYVRNDFDAAQSFLPKPKQWEKMLEIAETLSKEFPHVRVDLYNVNDTIYFGEMTFITEGGYFRYVPDDTDFLIGEAFDYYGRK